jgi:hypothetical protein
MAKGQASGLQQPANLHPATRDQYKTQNVADMRQQTRQPQNPQVQIPSTEDLAKELDDGNDDDLDISLDELEAVDETKE